jgi:hypothetical protein
VRHFNLRNRADDRLFPVSRKDSAVAGPNLHVIAAQMLVQKVTGPGEGRGIVRQFDSVETLRRIVLRAQIEGVHRHRTVSVACMTMGPVYEREALPQLTWIKAGKFMQRPLGSRSGCPQWVEAV